MYLEANVGKVKFTTHTSAYEWIYKAYGNADGYYC